MSSLSKEQIQYCKYTCYKKSIIEFSIAICLQYTTADQNNHSNLLEQTDRLI